MWLNKVEFESSPSRRTWAKGEAQKRRTWAKGGLRPRRRAPPSPVVLLEGLFESESDIEPKCVSNVVVKEGDYKLYSILRAKKKKFN